MRHISHIFIFVAACGRAPEVDAPCSGEPSEAAAPAPARTVAHDAAGAPSAPDRAALLALPGASREAVLASPVPALVPADVATLGRATVVTREHYYALSSRGPGMTVSVMGRRLAHAYPGVGPAEGRARVRGAPAFVTQNEGVWSVSWIEREIAYSVDVECESASDARCVSAAFVTSLAEGLVYAGGGRAAEVPR
jgi:hypothetical protein